MALNRYAPFYGAYNASLKKGCMLTKTELVSEFTEGRTESLQELTDGELLQLVKNLNSLSGVRYKPATPEEELKDSMRKAIISQFLSIYRKPSAAIAWAEKYGVNGQKRRFNDYTAGELHILIQNAKKVADDWRAAIRKTALS